MRIVLRWIALKTPYCWYGFATRFRDDDSVVGKDFFQQFAQQTHSYFTSHADSGLMESIAALDSDVFNHKKVHPLIKEFYEKTSHFDINVSIKWNPLIKPLGILYRKLIADKAKQLLIPTDNENLNQLDSWIELIDLNHDYYPEFRCWIRVNKITKQPIYIGAYRTYKSFLDDKLTTFVSVAFPIPGGNLTTVLRPTNFNDDGLKLSTRNTNTTEAGVYLIFPHKRSFSMIPALGLSEQFELSPKINKIENYTYVHVRHSCFWLGIKAFEMTYKITLKKEHLLSYGIRTAAANQSELLGNG